MLLVHQAGSVKVGEVVRYTVTYTPSRDRILPTPSHLHVKIKNTSPIPLRAAYLHGPYSLHVAAYSSTYNPNVKVEEPGRYGVPEFEPFLKAGSNWTCKLIVPEDIRENGASFAKGHDRRRSTDSTQPARKEVKSVTWIIEIASQIIFSPSAAVHFEVLVGRDEKSLDLGFAAVAGHGHGAPGQVHDHRHDKKRPADSPPKGVYSRAVKLVVEDTEALWDKPKLPTWEDLEAEKKAAEPKKTTSAYEKKDKRRKRKIHLVMLTHGLHSNLSADMLYLKESIDGAARQAKEERRKAKTSSRRTSKDSRSQADDDNPGPAPLTGGQEDLEEYDEDEEQVIVRGFSGNATRTERGIQYLGKRLAKYILRLTYPSQPFLPIKKSVSRRLTDKFTQDNPQVSHAKNPASHHGSTIHREAKAEDEDDLAYDFTSISFVGHSLGGLVQLYAIAYIQKHAPAFFEQIKPVNFICMASPLLGLSNENPMYVKFALDFGLVGRTGQDLGLTWRAPTIAKNGWYTVLGGFSGSKEPKQEDPGAKPLLRILPTGPAHHVLHLFRNRTLYSNVVNDGIVPLRTSCLLFLDWKGLGRVDKARRENGLISTLAEFTFSELMGANAGEGSPDLRGENDVISRRRNSVRPDDGEEVPQPAETATEEDNKGSGAIDPSIGQFLQPRSHNDHEEDDPGRRHSSGSSGNQTGQTSSFFGDMLNFFRPKSAEPPPEKKHAKLPKAIQRGQTLSKEQEEALAQAAESRSRSGTMDNPTMRPLKRPIATRGDSVNNPGSDVQAPPTTSVFEAASDILHPPIPSTSWITDPSSRQRTIFHDRVYHPEDIPPPRAKVPSRLVRTFSSDAPSSLQKVPSTSSADSGAMKVEEKIARAYHRDLSWRKVLVSLEPDAHNNMVVRRMFANAYGWPVVKHVCDTHFAYTWSAQTRDEDEPAVDRAAGIGKKVSESGEEVRGQMDLKPPVRKDSEMRETRDELGGEDASTPTIEKIEDKHKDDHEQDSGVWDDSYFSDTDDDDDDDEKPEGYKAMMQRMLSPNRAGAKSPETGRRVSGSEQMRPNVAVDAHGKLVPNQRPRSSEVPAPTPAIADKLVEEPPSIDTSNAGVQSGLKESLDEAMPTPTNSKGDDNGQHEHSQK